MRRQLSLKDPYLGGDDIKEVQRALGFKGKAVDGDYGPDTAGAVEEWKWRVGRPLSTSPGFSSEFALVDGEGAPDRKGVKHHAGKDWFAPGKSPVRAPVAGVIIEALVRPTTTGQVSAGA